MFTGCFVERKKAMGLTMTTSPVSFFQCALNLSHILPSRHAVNGRVNLRVWQTKVLCYEGTEDKEKCFVTVLVTASGPLFEAHSKFK